MTVAEKNIVETYARMLEELSDIGKLELLETLARSLKRETKSKEDEFFKSSGGFESDKSGEGIADEIKASRRFRNEASK